MGTEAQTEVLAPVTGELMEHPGDTQMLDLAKLMAAAQGERRNVRDCIKAAIEIVTLDVEAAEECIYKVPRGNEIKMGPSVGLAETLASCWGKMITGIDRYEIGEEDIVIWGASFDLQSGMGFKGMVQRSILDKNGKRYKRSIIQDNLMAAQSILYRDLTLRLIPRPIVRTVYRAALALATGEGKSWTERQKNVVDRFIQLGVSESDLLRHIGRTSRNDINSDDLEYLTAINNEVKDRPSAIPEVFSKVRAYPDLQPPAKVNPADLDDATRVLNEKLDADAKKEDHWLPPRRPDASKVTPAREPDRTINDTAEDSEATLQNTDPPEAPKKSPGQPSRDSITADIEKEIERLNMPTDDLNVALIDLLSAEDKYVPGAIPEMKKLSVKGLKNLAKWLSTQAPTPEQGELS